MMTISAISRHVTIYGTLMVIAAVETLAASPAIASQGVELMNLRCEYRVEPLGIDTLAPRLSWEINDSRRGARQSAYQIIVSTDESMADDEQVVWDSGKVESDQSINVAYAGSPLVSGRRYFWKVRIWDADDVPTGYSHPTWWEMGLIKTSDWGARWITAELPEEANPQPNLGAWIWSPETKSEGQTVFFRRTLVIPDIEKVERAVVRITADDHCIFFCNGQEIWQDGVWEDVVKYSLLDYLQTGTNVVAVRASKSSGPGGMIAGVRIDLADGSRMVIDSDEQWRVAEQAPAHWIRADFDDSAWAQAVKVAEYGADPWKKLNEPLDPRRSILVRKEFSLKGPIKRARVYASGLGLYELHINGQRVGQDVFTPGWTHYPKRVQYQTYDVTESLQQGGNAIGAVLGNGWWSGGQGWKSEDSYKSGSLRFLAQLNIEYADGSEETIVTDGSWRAHPSPITRNSFYHGEHYDARLEIPGWSSLGLPADLADQWMLVTELDDSLDRMAAQPCETIRVTEELRATQISEPAKGVYVFDFEQNASGRIRLKVKGERGTRVRLRFAEILKPDGNIYCGNYRSAEVDDSYILKGEGEEVWEPSFTYRGFRYCQVTGYPGTPTKDSLVHRVLHSAMPAAGKFECSNWLLNRIFQNITWGQRSNLHSVPTDCPQRDERLGWMGDAQAFSPTACWNMQMASFWTKWMRDITDSQDEKEGFVTDVAPVVVVRSPAKPGWGDAVIIIPWTVYEFYGDTRIIEENYDAMVAWVEYMQRESKDHIYEPDAYGDWVAPATSPTKPIGTAYFYYSTKLLSKMAALIGKSSDSDKYAELARQIAHAFNQKYFDSKTNNYPSGTQTANLLPLCFGITPEDRRTSVFENIVGDVELRDDHLSTGFLGTSLLLPALTEGSQHELAYRLATQTSYPSWGYMVRHGATTIWERWNSDKMGPGMNSRNHFAFGVIGQWFFEALAGINIDPDYPGFKKFLIRPQPVSDLTWVCAEHHSMYGLIKIAWRRNNQNDLTLKVTIPANTSAKLFVPLFGGEKPNIIEGSTPLLLNGQEASKVPGVTFLRLTTESAIFEVGAGEYTFVSKGY